MTYTRTTWVDNSTLVDAAKMNNIETELALLDPLVTSIPQPTLSAMPPGSPVDGQQWFYPLSTGGSWQFRYNAGSASAYKWEFAGGPPLSSQTAGPNDMNTVAGVYTGVSFTAITVPRDGEYQIALGTGLQSRAAYTGPFDVYIAPITPAGVRIGSPVLWMVVIAQYMAASISGLVNNIALTAGSGVTMGIYCALVTAMRFESPWIALTPRRVS